jgi:hypothetical protein
MIHEGKEASLAEQVRARIRELQEVGMAYISDFELHRTIMLIEAHETAEAKRKKEQLKHFDELLVHMDDGPHHVGLCYDKQTQECKEVMKFRAEIEGGKT